MIFPDVPRRRTMPLAPGKTPPTAQAPLQGSEVPKDEDRIRIEQWFESRGMGLGPAAGVASAGRLEPIDWWSKDALEFYLLCLAMICWIVYCAGAHYGYWGAFW